MESVEMLQELREELARNEGKWDLTDDCGNPVVYDCEKDVYIPELALMDGKTVCAVIPLGDFGEETISNIHQIVK